MAFTTGSPYLGGMSRFLLLGMTLDSVNGLAKTIPESVYMCFQMTFAIITPALICGAVADRMKFSALMWFIGLWSILVYAPIAHWVWGEDGFLNAAGVLDYAGGTVVHINSGVAGLMCCLMLGKRVGYGTEPMAPHNLVYSVIGASLLWVGWFGFNAGSAVTAGTNAGMAMAVTQIATATAALTWMFVEWALKGKPSILGICSGAVAGLVAITPASGFVDPRGALIIGIAAGILCYWGVSGLKNALGYDDSLDAFGVHGVGGTVGAILTGVLAVSAIGGEGKSGLIDGNAYQVVTQLYGIAVVVLYDAIVSLILLKLIDLTLGLRVDSDTEREGLDLVIHGEVVP
jgi:ammonium transporter, Amt family